jgi:hypothetical protein
MRFPGGADLPGLLALQQLLHGVRAGHGGPGGEGEHEGRRDPQHVRLAALLQVLPQPGAAAVDLVAAGEVEGQAVRPCLVQDADGQLPLGAEPGPGAGP